MQSKNIFKAGDSVNYRNGMDYKNFTGIVEQCIDYKGLWHYLVRDIKDNQVKRVGENYLSLSGEVQGTVRKSKFKVGDSVKYRSERDFQVFSGIVERSINNYQGQWQYMVKDGNVNVVKRVDEKNLELN